MKSHHILFVGFSLIGLIIMYVIWNVGLLQPVLIEEVNTQASVLVFKKHMGPYHDVGKVFEEVEKKMTDAGMECTQTFGLYYDNPDQAEHERLRADIGCVLLTPPTAKVEGLEVKEWPSFKALRGSYEGAPWLTAFKVYRALDRSAQEKRLAIEKGPVWEVYNKIPRGFRTQVHYRIAQ